MSTPIAIFYHAILSGGARNVNFNYAVNLVAEQMFALRNGGLIDKASEFHVGLNGNYIDQIALSVLCGKSAVISCHGPDAVSEIPTLAMIQQWVSKHPNWYVVYHHTKGVSTANHVQNWRRRMERFVITRWQDCVAQLESGKDACGCHWLTPETNPGTINSPFFGGNFWWAKSKYLMSLPILPKDSWENRYEAEVWIGKGKKRPFVHDFYPGWPTLD